MSFKEKFISKPVVKYSLIFLPIFIVIISAIFYISLHDPDFYIDDIPKNVKKQLIESGKWNENCPVSLDRLKLINVKFFQNKDLINRNGNFLVLDVVAPSAIKIFKALYKKEFIIENIKTINFYDSHQASIVDNNSISYLCENKILAKWEIEKLYPYGTAFDINPRQNPMLEYKGDSANNIVQITTEIGSALYLNRQKLTHNCPTARLVNENISNIFYKNGFTEWGGNWTVNIAWQYFSVNPIVNKLIFSMPPANAAIFFKIILKNIEVINRLNSEEFFIEMQFLYHKNPKFFLKSLNGNLKKLKKMTDSEFFSQLHEQFNKI